MRIAITLGEPAGCGPDCIVLAAQTASPVQRVVVGDANVLADRAKQLNIPLKLLPFDPHTPALPQAPGTLHVLSVPLNTPVTPGVLHPQNSAFVLRLLDEAIAGCLDNTFAAMVTAPVHKGIINDAGIPFSGHTEYLAEKTHSKKVVMVLSRANLRIALVTTHLPLRAVPDAITVQAITETLNILHHDLTRLYGIVSPRIAVTGLNPHAGEGGHLGREEIEIITPALNVLRETGMMLHGPVSADTAFTSHALESCDAVCVMYHDQGLPVIKTQGFGETVNVTCGLPLIRTSVDHGTALQLAGTGHVHADSLMAAIDQAVQFAQRGSL